MQVVVYSTCSVHDEENEDVVAAVLKANPNFELAPALPQWPTRGKPLFPHAEFCMRTCKDDRTIGFFVARFVRKGSAYAVMQPPRAARSASASSSSSPASSLVSSAAKTVELELVSEPVVEVKSAAVANPAGSAAHDEDNDAQMEEDASAQSGSSSSSGSAQTAAVRKANSYKRKRKRSQTQPAKPSSSVQSQQQQPAPSQPNPRKERRRLRKKQKRNAIAKASSIASS